MIKKECYKLSKISGLVKSGRRGNKREIQFLHLKRKEIQTANKYVKMFSNIFIMRHMIYYYTVLRTAKAKISDINKCQDVETNGKNVEKSQYGW